MIRSLLLSVCGTLSLCFVGCGSVYHPPRFNEPDGANGVPVAVIPFRQSMNDCWYGDCVYGNMIVEVLTDWAMQNAYESYFVGGDRFEELMDVVSNWTASERLEPRDWQQIAGSAGAKYLVVGDIKVMERDRKFVNMVRIQLQAVYEVIDLETGKRVYKGDEPLVYPGPDEERQLTFSVDFGGGETEARRRAVRALGERIGKELYGYEED